MTETQFYGSNEARSAAFRAVPETCPIVHRALEKALWKILGHLGRQEDTRIEMILDAAFDEITKKATIPLRRVLIDAEQKAIRLMNNYIAWQPIETAPRNGSFILLAGPSGYMGTPLRVEVCKYDEEYRPLQPWVNHAGYSFLDGGEAPTYWMHIPNTYELPSRR